MKACGKRTRRMIIGTLLCLFFVVKGHAAKAEAWPDNTIGAGFGVQARPGLTTPDDLKRIKAAGFNYVRYDVDWGAVERSKGDYDWGRLDHFIGMLRKYHLKSVAILNGSNSLYAKKVGMVPEESFGNSWAYAAPTSEDEINAFAAFAAAAVDHFGTDDIIWELWNEPDMAAFWPPAPNAEAFAFLADRTCLAIRKVAPKATIIGPAVSRLPNRIDLLHERFFRIFMESPVVKCLNAISVHPYRRKDEPPETVMEDYETKVRPFIEAYTPEAQKPLPIVDSEWGYTTTDHATPEQQAAYVLRIHLANLLSGVPLSILYEWKDSPHMVPESEMHYGLIDTQGKNKPGADIIDRLLPRIENAVIIQRLPVEDDDCFVVVIKQPDGHYQLLAWVGSARLETKPVLQVKDAAGGKTSAYPLSLVPQIMDIASSTPRVSINDESVQ